MVNFFASGCGPCRAEHPFLSALTEETGVPLYGINHRDKPEDAAAWLAELSNPYRRIGADPGRAAVEWGVTGVPATFIIDGNGRISWHHRGPLVPEIIERDVKPLLAALGLCGRCSSCCLCCCLPRRRLRWNRARCSTTRCWSSARAISPPRSVASSARTHRALQLGEESCRKK